MSPRPFVFALILLCLTVSTRIAFGQDDSTDASVASVSADAGTVAVAPVVSPSATPDPTSDPSGYAALLLKVAKDKRWFSLACFAVFGLCLALRKLVKAFQGRGVKGQLVTFGVAFAGMLGAATVNMKLPTFAMLTTAFGAAGGATLIYLFLEQLAVPGLKKLLGKTYGEKLGGALEKLLKTPKPAQR